MKYTFEIEAIDDECKPEVGVQAALKAASDPAIIASAGHYMLNGCHLNSRHIP